jgi:hypothetical protein
MKTVNYISHMLEDNVEEIKALALYFDQINIVEQRHLHIVAPKGVKPDKNNRIKADVISTNDFTDEKFLLHLKDFEKEKIIKYLIDIDSGDKSPKNDLFPVSSDMQINNLVLFHTELIGKKQNEKQIFHENGIIELAYEIEFNKESEIIFSTLFKNSNNFNPLVSYYAKVFKTFVNYYEQGKDVLTSSKYVNDLFRVIYKTDRFKQAQVAFKNEFNVTPSLAFEAIKLGLPNLGKFPPDEILRFKEKSKGELVEFQSTMERITFDLINQYDFDYINTNAQKIVDLKISPLVENIGKSLGNSKSKLIQDLINEAKDPKSYSPLLLTFSDKISNTLILMISAGMIGINTGLEYYSRIKEAKNDGVYYLYKMKKYFA